MWQPESYPASLKEALAMHSLLSTLGYSLRDEVFLILNPDFVLVRLKAEGREVDFKMGPSEHNFPVMRDHWVAILREWNTGGSATQADKNALCVSTKVWRARQFFVEKLCALGFTRAPIEASPPHEMN